MIRFSALILVSLISITAYSEFDAGLAASYRSYPLGGALDANVGQSAVFYGNPGSPSDPYFGYLRAELDGSVSSGYSGWGYQFQFFPISFLGVTAGQFFYDNEQQYTAYNCDTYFCTGTFREDFVEGRIALAYNSFFLVARLKTSVATEHNSENKDYVSPDYSLALGRRHDEVRRTNVLAGYDLNEHFAVIANYIHSRAEESEQEATFYTAGVLYKQNKFKVGLLGGVFEHDHPDTRSALDKTQDVTIMTSLQWNIVPSVALF